ncbi:hypothetical protein PVAND_003695 [Polypedilum vanderplanki]|uniref:Nucleoplasmin core domain-containing protein n=1 Tax=Polypedilum vanderplanki TaxID=319348 RepID=A0A9J6BVX8_POLVA|nr:hypothetical protein PVAND_003695 [Polypedilum vanderplanki]
MADEFFYGVTLKEQNAEVVWNPESATTEEIEYARANKLIVKQILLGVEAKADEYNVVEVETKGEDSLIKIPIAVLKVGENRCSQSFLEFPDNPVTFRLIQGNGPVHIHGHHLVGELETEDDDEDNFEEEEYDEDEGEDDEPKSKKAKVISSNNSKNTKNEKNKKK